MTTLKGLKIDKEKMDNAAKWPPFIYCTLCVSLFFLIVHLFSFYCHNVSFFTPFLKTRWKLLGPHLSGSLSLSLKHLKHINFMVPFMNSGGVFLLFHFHPTVYSKPKLKQNYFGSCIIYICNAMLYPWLRV